MSTLHSRRSQRFSHTLNLFGLTVCLWLLALIPAPAVIRDGGVDPSNLGQGGWLYIMKDATNKLGGNIPGVTNESSLFGYMKSIGFNYVIVKAATSNTLWFGSYTFPQFTSNLVNAAHAQGLFIFGSNRSWGNDNPGEIAMADYVFNVGADGYIWDAESEWESGNPWITNGPAQAWQLCSTIRAHWPTKFLAHNPYDTLYLHASFPFKEFGYWSDAVMPQVYHHSASQGNAIAAIHWTDVNYKKFQDSLPALGTTMNAYGSGINATWTNALKPLVLMRDVYEGTYPDQDVQNFVDYLVADPNCVTAGGYRGSDYFRSELNNANQWAYMKAATIGNFSNVVNNIILDDPAAVRTGSWTSVKTIDATTSTVTFSGATGTDTNSFGTNYLSKTQGTGAAYVQFNLNILTAGDYDVYQWHPFRANASTNVPFIISYSGGTNTVLANQQTNPGNWSLLGRFNFLAGSNGYVRVTDAVPDTNTIAMVDGLKLAYVVPTGPPVISGVGVSDFADTYVTITWTTDQSSDSAVEYGVTTNYGALATNPALAYSHSIAVSNLVPSTTYHYRVKSKALSSTQTTSDDFTLTTLPSGVIGTLIIDNTNAAVIGAWSTGSNTVDEYGADYQFKTNSGNGSTYLKYTPALGITGLYRVYEWHSQGTIRTTNAPHVINYFGGSQTIAVNQQVNGGQWNPLGSFIFGIGTKGNLQITDAFAETNKVLIADAIKFAYVSPAPFAFGNIFASPRQNGAIITWNTTTNATTQVQFGVSTNYDQMSALDSTGLTNHLVWLTGLSSNTNYFYRVLASIGTNQYLSSDYSFFTDPSVIVDSSMASFSGVWTVASAATDKYNDFYKYAASATGSDTAQATFRPNITTPGNYDVYIWYSKGTNRSLNAPLVVGYSGGSFTTNLDMSANGGVWQLLLANRYFAAGTNGFLRLGNGTGESGKVVIADAARWTYTPGQDASFVGSVPAWWSNFYFGSDSIPGTDVDGDGYTPFMEYVLGTDPTTPGSQLKLRAETLPGGGIAVIFSPYLEGRAYELQTSDSLTAVVNWSPLLTAPASVNTNGGGVITVTNFSGVQKFLRLSVRLVP